MASAYRDGVFSAASPAPRYGSLLTAFENGSLGGLEEEAAQALDPTLDAFIVQTEVAFADLPAQQKGARLAASTALDLARHARATPATAIDRKLGLTIAAAYAGSNFSLPQNSLLDAVGAIMGTFAMTAHQRNVLRQEAAGLYLEHLTQNAKGNAMAGGILGSVYRDGILGNTLVSQQGAVRDGTLGLVPQQGAVRDGSLGRLTFMDLFSGRNQLLTRSNFRSPRMRMRHVSGLGLTRAQRLAAMSATHRTPHVPTVYGAMRAKRLAGLGCGCAGVGDDAAPADAVAAPTPLYKQPLVIGGAAVVLGVVLYAVTR